MSYFWLRACFLWKGGPFSLATAAQSGLQIIFLTRSRRLMASSPSLPMVMTRAPSTGLPTEHPQGPACTPTSKLLRVLQAPPKSPSPFLPHPASPQIPFHYYVLPGRSGANSDPLSHPSHRRGSDRPLPSLDTHKPSSQGTVGNTD